MISANEATLMIDKKTTAGILIKEFIILLCNIKTNKDAKNVIAKAGNTNDFIYSE